jgi:hypothetical protein
VGKIETQALSGEIGSGGAKRGISLNSQMLAALKTRAGRRKLWEGLSECQLKTVCPTEDGDFLARTAESKQRGPECIRLGGQHFHHLL